MTNLVRAIKEQVEQQTNESRYQILSDISRETGYPFLVVEQKYSQLRMMGEIYSYSNSDGEYVVRVTRT